MTEAVFTSAAADGEVQVTGELPSVEDAWSRVMGEVTVLGKDSRNDKQGFNFRGIDAVMNLLGPVLRKHGVFIIPGAVNKENRDFTNRSGTVMHEVSVQVEYTIFGPRGDAITGSSFGEASDAGDKATPKAMSVAYRTFLLQALCLPTDEPDPDSHVTDRAPVNTKAQDAANAAKGLLDPAVAIAAVQRVKAWSIDKGIMDEQVVDAEGNSMPLARLFERVEAGLSTATDGEAQQVLKDSLGATEESETKEENA